MELVPSKIWNVIAKIPGDSDETVVLGNHRDGWVFGAVDPSSATAVMLETSRAFGNLLKKGWRPKRTIVLASWDAEEQGLIGSTHWVEQNADFLSEKAVAYLNVDEAAYGPNFAATASSSLSSLIKYVSTKVNYPGTKIPISQKWNNKIETLGSGSDYTAFLHHLGIPSLDIRFEGEWGVYHSIYDSFYWMENFGDPDFTRHAAISSFWAVLALQLSCADEIPLNFYHTSTTLVDYLETTKNSLSQNPEILNKILPELSGAISDFGNSTLSLNDANILTREKNDILMRIERKFLYSGGLPDRPWYKHMLQAPGFWKGYGADSFPALTQAIETQQWTDVEKYATIISSTIKTASTFILDEISFDKDTAPTHNIVETVMVALFLFLVAVVLVIFGVLFYYRRFGKRKMKSYQQLELEDTQ
eukprot:TRINITY_DN3011_c0_g1_i2.p1 TRINITY_DN3011_c0_g1~~TRINITY_DN3011_c0_g1_i2.p1  ORF type:complete len:418 (-),score=101.61 TRINITY_DN3011_c0_g1_i2:74-1327(-)